MLTAPVVDRSTVDPPASPGVAIVPGWAPPVVTARGRAAVHRSDFQDCWNNLTHADREWFAEWLTTLLVDACEEAPAPTA